MATLEQSSNLNFIKNSPSLSQKETIYADNAVILNYLDLQNILNTSFEILINQEISRIGIGLLSKDIDEVLKDIKNIPKDAGAILQNYSITYALAKKFNQNGLQDLNSFIPSITNSITHILKGENIDLKPYALNFSKIILQKVTGCKNIGVSYYILDSKNYVLGKGFSRYIEERYSVDYYYYGWAVGCHVGSYQFYVDNDDITMFEKGTNVGNHMSFSNYLDNSLNIKWGTRYTFFKPNTDGNGITTHGHCIEKYKAKFDMTYTIFGYSLTINLPAWRETKNSEFWRYKEDNTPFYTRTYNGKNLIDYKNSDKIENLNNEHTNENYNYILKLALKCIPTQDIVEEKVLRYKESNFDEKKYFNYTHKKDDKLYEVGITNKPNYDLNVTRDDDIINIDCKHSDDKTMFEDLIQEIITKKSGWIFRSKKTTTINHEPGEIRTEQDLSSFYGNFNMQIGADGKPLFISIKFGNEELVYARYSYDNGFVDFNDHKGQVQFVKGQFSVGTKYNIEVFIIENEVESISGDYNGTKTRDLNENDLENKKKENLKETQIFSTSNKPLMVRNIKDSNAEVNLENMKGLKKSLIFNSEVTPDMWNNIKYLLPSVNDYIQEFDIIEIIKESTVDNKNTVQTFMTGTFSTNNMDFKYNIKNGILNIKITGKGDDFKYTESRDKNNNPIKNTRETEKIGEHNSSNNINSSNEPLYTLETDLGIVNIYADNNKYFGKILFEDNKGELETGYNKIGSIYLNNKEVCIRYEHSCKYNGELKNNEIPQSIDDFNKINSILDNDAKIYYNKDGSPMKTEKRDNAIDNRIDTNNTKILKELGFVKNEKINFIFSNLEKFSDSVDIKFMHTIEGTSKYTNNENPEENLVENYKKDYGDYYDILNQSIKYEKPNFMKIIGNLFSKKNEANIKIQFIEFKKNYNVEDTLKNNETSFEPGENREITLNHVSYLNYELEVNYFGGKIFNFSSNGKNVIIYGKFNNKLNITLTTKLADDNQRINIINFVKTNGLFGVTNYKDVEVFVIIEKGTSITGETNNNYDFDKITPEELVNSSILENEKKKIEEFERVTFVSKDQNNPIKKDVEINGNKYNLLSESFERPVNENNSDNQDNGTNNHNDNQDNGTNNHNDNYNDNHQNNGNQNHHVDRQSNKEAIISALNKNSNPIPISGTALGDVTIANLFKDKKNINILKARNQVEKKFIKKYNQKLLNNLNQEYNEDIEEYEKSIYGYAIKQCQGIFNDDTTKISRTYGRNLGNKLTYNLTSHSNTSIDEKLIRVTDNKTGDLINESSTKEYSYTKSSSGFISTTTTLAKKSTSMNNDQSIDEFVDDVENNKVKDMKIVKDLAPHMSSALNTIGRELILNYSRQEKFFSLKTFGDILSKSGIIYTGYYLEDVLSHKGISDYSILPSLAIVSTCFLGMTDWFAKYNYGTIESINDDNTFNIKCRKNMKKNISKNQIKMASYDNQKKMFKIIENLSYNEIDESIKLHNNLIDFINYCNVNLDFNQNKFLKDSDHVENESQIFIKVEFINELSSLINSLNKLLERFINFTNRYKFNKDLNKYEDENINNIKEADNKISNNFKSIRKINVSIVNIFNYINNLFEKENLLKQNKESDNYIIINKNKFYDLKNNFLKFKLKINKNYNNYFKENDLVGIKYDVGTCTKDGLRTGVNLGINQLVYNLSKNSFYSSSVSAIAQIITISYDSELSKYQKREQYTNAALVSLTTGTLIPYISTYIWNFAIWYSAESLLVKSIATVAIGVVGALVITLGWFLIPKLVSWYTESTLPNRKKQIINRVNEIIKRNPRIGGKDLILNQNDNAEVITKKFRKIMLKVHPDKIKNVKLTSKTQIELNSLKEEFKNLNDINCRLNNYQSKNDKNNSHFLSLLIDHADILFSNFINDTQKLFLREKQKNHLEGVDWFSSEYLDFQIDKKNTKMKINYNERGNPCTYEGDIKNVNNTPVFHGNGELIQDCNGDKVIYKGMFENNKRHGKGKLKITDCDETKTYILQDGEFRNNQFINGNFEKNSEETDDNNNKLNVIIKYKLENFDFENKKNQISTTDEYYESIDIVDKNEKIEKIGYLGNIDGKQIFIRGVINRYNNNNLIKIYNGTFINGNILQGDDCSLEFNEINSGYNCKYKGIFINNSLVDDNGTIHIKHRNDIIKILGNINNFETQGIVNLNHFKLDNNEEIKYRYYNGSIKKINGLYHFDNGLLEYIETNNNEHNYYRKTYGQFSNSMILHENLSGKLSMEFDKENIYYKCTGDFTEDKMNGVGESKLIDKKTNKEFYYNGSFKNNMYLEGKEISFTNDNNLKIIKEGNFINNQLSNNSSLKVYNMNTNELFMEMNGNFQKNEILEIGNITFYNTNNQWGYKLSYEFYTIVDFKIQDFNNIKFNGKAKMKYQYNDYNTLEYDGEFDSELEFPHFKNGYKKEYNNQNKILSESYGNFENDSKIAILNGNGSKIISINEIKNTIYEGKFKKNSIVNGTKTYIVNDKKIIVYKGNFKIHNDIIIDDNNNEIQVKKSVYHSFKEESILKILDDKKVIKSYKGKFMNNKFISGTIFEQLSDNIIHYKTGKFKDNEVLYGNSSINMYKSNILVTSFNGKVINKNYNGFGKLYLNDGETITKYKGNFKDGKFNGKGCIELKSINDSDYQKIAGEFVDQKCINGFLIKKDSHNEFKSRIFTSNNKDFFDKVKILYQNKDKKYETIGVLDDNDNTNIYVNNIIGKQILYKDDKKIHEYCGYLKDNIPHGFGIIEKFDKNKTKKLIIYNNGTELQYNEFLNILILLVKLIFRLD